MVPALFFRIHDAYPFKKGSRRPGSKGSSVSKIKYQR
jgi:hypothetical protein